MLTNQLQSAVIDDVQCKSWVFNPVLAQMVKSKELELEREDKAWQREEERQQWLDELSTERLIELLMPALKNYWLTEGYMTVNDGYELLPQEVAARLARRGFKDADDTVLLKKEGLLHCLDDIRSRHLSKRSVGKWSGLEWLGEEPALHKYLTLGLMALKAYPLNLSVEDVDRVSKLRQKVNESLDAGQRTYARPASHDALIGRLFPPMRKAVSKPYGTLTALQKAEREQAAERARVEAERTAAIRRQRQIEDAQRQKAFEENEKRRQKLDGLLLRQRVHTWKSDTSASTIETVLRQFNVVRMIKNYERSGMDVEALLRSAWESRARGHTFRLWISEQSEQDTAKEILMVEALRVAGLVS